jgi:hypothetical protein
MRKRLRDLFTAFGKANEFHEANPHTDPGAQALADQLVQGAARGEAMSVQRRHGSLTAKAANARKSALRRGPIAQGLRHLVRVTELASRERPELAGAVRFPPDNESHEAFLTAARQMLAVAEANREVLLTHGLTETMLADLTTLLDRYEAEIATAVGAFKSRVEAVAELETLGRELTQVLGILDGLNRFRLREEPELLAAWQSLTRIPRKNGHRNGTPAEPPATGEGGDATTP